MHPGHPFWKNYHPVIPSKAVKVGVIAWTSPWFLYMSAFQGAGKTINQTVSHQITWIQIPGQFIFFLKKLFVLSNNIHFFPIVFIMLYFIFKILWFLEALIIDMLVWKCHQWVWHLCIMWLEHCITWMSVMYVSACSGTSAFFLLASGLTHLPLH